MPDDEDKDEGDTVRSHRKCHAYQPRCQALAEDGTYSGEQCGLTADESGYCWVHRD